MKLYLVLFVSIFAESFAANYLNETWWKTAVFYQIYPRSFKDSNGDGIGDIQGIIEKLQHLKNAGVTGTWLSPVFSSPQVDFGYDISNFTDIDKQYGTLSDFDQLIKKADQLGIKIVLDFVPNHSSDKHEWFIKSANREKGYENYYIWHDGKSAPNGTRQPPNNWLSVFGGPAWTWHEGRKQYYYHQFYPQQPDLNYRDQAVVQEMHNVLRFWLKRGAAGFRVDAVPHLFEDPQLRDEPLSHSTTDPTSWNYLDHIYTFNLPEVFEVLQGWRDVLDEFASQTDNVSRVMMTEAYADMATNIKYYNSGASFTFNFGIFALNQDSDAEHYVNTINYWFNQLPKNLTSNWVLGNHDQPRIATRIGVEKVDGANMMTSVLPGIGVTYNGEEIGMENGYVPPEIITDNRDPERTPFQWDSSPNAGFTTGKPWLPVSDKYKEVNLELQSKSGIESHYHVYRAILEARKSPTLLYGSASIKKQSDNTFTIVRELKGEDTYVMVFNVKNKQETIDLTKVEPTIPRQMNVLISSAGAKHKKGDKVISTNLSVGAYEAYLLTGKP